MSDLIIEIDPDLSPFQIVIEISPRPSRDLTEPFLWVSFSQVWVAETWATHVGVLSLCWRVKEKQELEEKVSPVKTQNTNYRRNPMKTLI